MRLIDADKVIAKKITAGLSDATGNYYGYADVVFADDVEDAPTVDAKPVVHGRWILKETCGANTKKFHCSVCDKIPKSLCTEVFCPNCGAKMDGENDG